MHAVPLDVFESKIHSIRTYHDVLRIFYGNHILTDDIIDTMMMEDNAQYFHTPYGTMVGFSPVRQHVMGSSDRDTQAYEPSNSRRDKGKGISSDVLHDSPVICKDCPGSMSDVMFGDSTKSRNTGDSSHSSSNKHRGKKRRKKEKKKKKRKGRGRKRYRKGNEILFICCCDPMKSVLKCHCMID